MYYVSIIGNLNFDIGVDFSIIGGFISPIISSKFSNVGKTKVSVPNFSSSAATTLISYRTCSRYRIIIDKKIKPENTISDLS